MESSNKNAESLTTYLVKLLESYTRNFLARCRKTFIEQSNTITCFTDNSVKKCHVTSFGKTVL